MRENFPKRFREDIDKIILLRNTYKRQKDGRIVRMPFLDISRHLYGRDDAQLLAWLRTNGYIEKVELVNEKRIIVDDIDEFLKEHKKK